MGSYCGGKLTRSDQTKSDAMEDDLPKIDRWHSEPLDVHTWSDHTEIKKLYNDLYDAAGLTSLESKGNRDCKPKRSVK